MFEEMGNYLDPIGENTFALESGVYSIDTVKGEFRYETIKQHEARKKDEAELERMMSL